MKAVIGALAATTLLAGVAATQPAQARCVWTGFAWRCSHLHSWQLRHPRHWHRYSFNRRFRHFR